LFIEHPETGLHPKRERFIMSLLKKLSEEYGYKELVQPEHDLDGD
jgi:predicted ATP-dependent endonuclease of OLD family